MSVPRFTVNPALRPTLNADPLDFAHPDIVVAPVV
jgi:hypothetical protein